MKLIALTDKGEIKKGKEKLESIIKDGAIEYERTIGYKGGSGRNRVFWRQDNDFWCAIENIDNRYWFVYGVADPSKSETQGLSITCEINIPKGGARRAISGVLAKDENNNVFLAHSGKIGGGKTGIGMNKFLNWYQEASRAKVAYPEGPEREMIIIGQIDSKEFTKKISNFIKKVNIFKINSSAENKEEDHAHSFRPEFIGIKEYYRPEDLVKARSYHGAVVGALADLLQQNDIEIANNREVDLYVVRRGEVKCLFEIKTDLTTSSVYSAIGQLKYHSSSLPKCDVLIALFPGLASNSTIKAFKDIGIYLYQYTLKNKKICFPDSQSILSAVDPSIIVY